MTRPKAVLAMIPGVEDSVLTFEARRLLDSFVDLVRPEAVSLRALEDAELREIEVILGSWGCDQLDETLLERMPNARLLAYAAGTVKQTVTPSTFERGVRVTSAAAANAIPVAEFCFAAVIMIAKDVFRVRDRHREFRGTQHAAGTGAGLQVGANGLKVGIVGASKIGRLFINRLATIDVEVAVADPYLTAEAASGLGVKKVDLDDLCSWSDIVSLHAPALPSTKHLIGKEHLALLHDGAWLLNTARGALVDTDALTSECVSGRLCAFIDTPEPEPLPPDSPLYDLANVVLTPHIAGSLGNEIARMGDLAVGEIGRFLRGEALLEEVSAADLDRIA